MKLLDRISEQASDSGIVQPQPTFVGTTKISNPRLDNVQLDTSGDTSSLSGIFKIDITNTGFLKTRSTRITEAAVSLNKGDTSLNVGEINEPVKIPDIAPSSTETVMISFERNSQLVNALANNICDDKSVNASIRFTMAEIILAATYEERKALTVS